MRIKVYQINENLDSHRIKFCGYDSVLKNAGRVDPAIYKTVFDGSVECEDLEEIYDLLNSAQPPSYRGHSLSVSDIVEIIGEKGEKGGEIGTNSHFWAADGPLCYFCDTIGFQRVLDFDPSKCEPIRGGKRMVVIEPHKAAYEAVIDDSLESLQHAVGGYIEITYPFDDNAIVIGNEEAKLIGMEGNRHINGAVYAGPLLIAADDGEGGTTDLTDKQIEHYCKLFSMPEDITEDEVQADTGFVITGWSY
ncbi:MAG: DUF3846 domain-containing protein [Clostridiales bacterium]|nr:DUF3846 domain-containing protein [Clostridiales bacterium]